MAREALRAASTTVAGRREGTARARIRPGERGPGVDVSPQALEPGSDDMEVVDAIDRWSPSDPNSRAASPGGTSRHLTSPSDASASKVSAIHGGAITPTAAADPCLSTPRTTNPKRSLFKLCSFRAYYLGPSVVRHSLRRRYFRQTNQPRRHPRLGWKPQAVAEYVACFPQRPSVDPAPPTRPKPALDAISHETRNTSHSSYLMSSSRSKYSTLGSWASGRRSAAAAASEVCGSADAPSCAASSTISPTSTATRF